MSQEEFKIWAITLLLIIALACLKSLCYSEPIRVIYDDPYKCNIIYKIPKEINLEIKNVKTGWYPVHLDYKFFPNISADLDGWVYIY